MDDFFSYTSAYAHSPSRSKHKPDRYFGILIASQSFITMIVRNTEQGWELIYHYAHGLLAGEIAQRLKHSLRPERWVETLTAIVEHDDHQLDFDEKNYLNAVGNPLDFTEDRQTTAQILERAERVMAQAVNKSGWIALLISMHIDFLFGHLKKDGAKAKTFFDRQQKLRIILRGRYNLSEEKTTEYYELLRFCDRCSLILCQSQIPDRGRKLEINAGIAKKPHFIAYKNGKITVSPWCFELDAFEIAIEVHHIMRCRAHRVVDILDSSFSCADISAFST